MPVRKIGEMSLKNSGGNIIRGQFTYLNDDGEKKLTGQSGDITLGSTKTLDPGEMGVPDGSILYMHPFVVWGAECEAKDGLIYEKGNTSIAHYDFTSTALSSHISLIQITD